MPEPPSTATKFPDYFRISDLLSRSAGFDRPPFSDLCFDVAVESTISNPSMNANVGGSSDANSRSMQVVLSRFHAHAVVCAAHSKKLRREIIESPCDGPNGEHLVRVNPVITKRVWKCILQFFYSGVLHEHHIDMGVSSVLELFFACCVYDLPAPLKRYATDRVSYLLKTEPTATVVTTLLSMLGKPEMPHAMHNDPVAIGVAYIAIMHGHALTELTSQQYMLALLLIEKQIQQALAANPVVAGPAGAGGAEPASAIASEPGQAAS
jgi:hypothetical protein